MAADGPDEAGEFPGNSRRHDGLPFTPIVEMAVAMGEALLGFPGNGTDIGRQPLLAKKDRLGHPGIISVAPSRLNHHPADMAVSGLGDPSPLGLCPA